MSNVYSHRNGENEQPTIPGWYWVSGWKDQSNWEGSHMYYVDDPDPLYGKLAVWNMPSTGPEWLDSFLPFICWWGPLTPPWQRDYDHA